MTEHECIIGEYISYHNELVTLPLLLGQIQRRKEINESLEREASVYAQNGRHELSDEMRKHKNPEYSLADFCDRRKRTPLHHFNYCPICGRIIDWKSLGGNIDDRTRP